MKRLALMLALLVAPAFSQTVFYTDRALGVNPLTATPLFLAYAPVRICTHPSNGSPCDTPATITDANGNTLTIVGGNFGQLTTDVVGRWSIGCTPGLYDVQIAATGSNTPQLSYSFTCPSGTSALISNANVWTGTNTFNAGAFSSNFSTTSASPATSGIVRLASGDTICWRSFSASANVCLSKNNADQLVVPTLPNSASDIGAAINTAYAALPSGGGVITLPAGSFPIVTQISCGTNAKPCVIRGDAAGATTLTYGATSGTAINLAYGASHQYGGGLRDITLTGSCTTTACAGNTSVGVSVTSEGGYFQNVQIGTSGAGFLSGISYNTNGFLSTWVNAKVYNNATGLLQTGNTENVRFYGGSFGLNAVPVSITGNGDIYFDKVSFDDNTSATGQVSVTGGSGVTVGFTDCHFENVSLGSAQYMNLTAPATVYVRGGNMSDDRTVGTNPQFITANGANALYVDQTVVYSAGITVTQVVSPTVLNALYMNVMNPFPSRIPLDYTASFTGSVMDVVQPAVGSSKATYAFGGHLNQSLTGKFAGTCAMAAGTSCTITLAAAYTGTPGCVATVQGGVAIAGACSVSGTTVTVTAASANSATWAALLFGNPN